MEAEASLKNYYDEVYEKFDEIPRTSKIFTLRELERIEARASKKLVDVGCGTGANSTAISALGFDVYGLDLSSAAIGKYKERGFSGRTTDLNQNLQIEDSSFDVAFMSEVIEHVADPMFTLKEIRRILRPGGELILSTPNSAFWPYRILALLGFTLSEVQHPKHFHFFSKRSLIDTLSESGFRVNEVSGRNMYLLFTLSSGHPIEWLLKRFGLLSETRYKNRKTIWHVSHHAKFMNSFFADTLIVTAKRD